VRNAPYPIRPRRSSSVNDLYPKSNSAALAVQSLKGNKPSAVVKQIVRRSSLPPEGNSDPFSHPVPLQRASSNRSLPGEKKPARRRSSGSVELAKFSSTATPLSIPSHPPVGVSAGRSRVILAPTLSVITDRSGEPEHDPELGSLPFPHHDRKVRTRVFEYDENDQLVEVLNDEGDEKGEGGDGDRDEDEDDHSYDEEYIDVIYEDDSSDENGATNDGELHVFESSGADVASHITWM
jgi:hypothetical protein